MTPLVTLFGKLLKSQEPGCTVFDVNPRLGTAAERLGLAGKIRLLDRQVIEANYGPDWDIVRMPEHVAASLAKKQESGGRDQEAADRSQEPETKRRKRG